MLLSAVGLLLQMVSATPPDAQALRAAKSAQHRFESARRARLPVEWHGGDGRCDTRVGRYCYWYDSADAKRIAEPKAIGDARQRLLSVLDSQEVRSPADPWIVGQRVRYLVEAGRIDDAVAAARACAAAQWWCAALDGLALHVGERYVEAESAFDVALGAMPRTQRCAWEDIRVLLSGALAHELDRADCTRRERLAARVLALAQPLWSTPGNDFRTEMLARRTMVALLETSANAQGMAWGKDSEELLLRYGWSEWFSRQEPSPLYYASTVVTGHDREPSYNLIPSIVTAASLPRVTANAWELTASRAVSRYAPRSLDALTPLRHQLARFPRGDSLLIAAAMAPIDTAMTHDSVVIALAAYDGDSVRVNRSVARALTLTVHNDSTIVSVEARGVRSKHASRARYTVGPLVRTDRGVVSDLLVYRPATGVSDDSLESALDAAVTEPRVTAGEPLGVYWETADVPRSNGWVSLTVEPMHIGLARRVAIRLHLAAEAAPVRLRWRAMLEGAQRHHVTVRMPPTARGSYRMQLAIDVDGTPLVSAREITIAP
ncbi:MAG TPA: hypothetical protein VJ867_00465 [Gemmatimonadaceae bacterium]|nr:hypothetical protein [Gemmatimonadaceae bacterium]